MKALIVEDEAGISRTTGPGIPAGAERQIFDRFVRNNDGRGPTAAAASAWLSSTPSSSCITAA